MTNEREQRLYDALKRITHYRGPDKLRKVAAKEYGLEPEEVIEMAYENVLEEAKQAIKGMRRPRSAVSRPAAPMRFAEFPG